MPTNKYGQMITFAVETGGDYRFKGYRYITVKKNRRTIRKIANFYGFPNLIRKICRLNNIRNPKKKLRVGRRLRVPGRLREDASFSVLAGDTAPRITDGYAKIDIVGRAGRAGLSVFTGYNPVVMEIPVRFEATDEGEGRFNTEINGAYVEDSIAELEKMAGRGKFAGAAVGAPPIVRVTTTDANGYVPLIPDNYQWTSHADPAPVWWISGIEWDADPIRNLAGERIRQLATITLTQYVKPRPITSSSQRHRNNRSDKGKGNRKGRTRRLKYKWPNNTWHTRPYRGN